MLEAVFPVAGGAVDADGGEGIDVGFAGWRGALFTGERCWLLALRCCRGNIGSFPPCGGVFACTGAAMRGFGTVVKAKGALAGFTAEGEEV